MPAYFIVENEVTDHTGFEEYRKQVQGIVEKYGGKFLVRGGEVQALEGDWTPKRRIRGSRHKLLGCNHSRDKPLRQDQQVG